MTVNVILCFVQALEDVEEENAVLKDKIKILEEKVVSELCLFPLSSASQPKQKNYRSPGNPT